MYLWNKITKYRNCCILYTDERVKNKNVTIGGAICDEYDEWMIGYHMTESSKLKQ